MSLSLAPLTLATWPKQSSISRRLASTDMSAFIQLTVYRIITNNIKASEADHTECTRALEEMAGRMKCLSNDNSSYYNVDCIRNLLNNEDAKNVHSQWNSLIEHLRSEIHPARVKQHLKTCDDRLINLFQAIKAHHQPMEKGRFKVLTALKIAPHSVVNCLELIEPELAKRGYVTPVTPDTVREHLHSIRRIEQQKPQGAQPYPIHLEIARCWQFLYKSAEKLPDDLNRQSFQFDPLVDQALDVAQKLYENIDSMKIKDVRLKAPRKPHPRSPLRLAASREEFTIAASNGDSTVEQSDPNR